MPVKKPITHYTKSGRINIAYQVFGKGTQDMVYVPGWVSNIDLMWRNPQLSDFLTSLGRHVRLILFDKRGTGLSDRVTELSTLEERMDDIRAVMDAVGSDKAILFGHSEGGSVCTLFAATYPHRTISLITFGVFAKRRYAPEYPWAPTDEERQKVYDMIEQSWGSSKMDLASLAPSMVDDRDFMEWLSSYFRSGASPSAALVLTRMNTQVDIIDILDTIEVPTLLLYRTDDIDVKVEEGRFIAERIKGSKFVEFAGNDHLFWVGDAKSVLTEMINFIVTDHDQHVFNRILATILKIKVEGLGNQHALYGSEYGDAVTENLSRVMQSSIKQYRGGIVESNHHFTTATFEGPSKAVHCAIEIKKTVQGMGLQIAQGIHIGECIISSRQELGGRAVKVAEELLATMAVGAITITHTVKNLLSGAGLEFRHHSLLEIKGENAIQILSLVENEDSNGSPEEIDIGERLSVTALHNHSFLENVLQSIENHLADDQFSIDTLCREVGVSERQLQRKLKSITNKTPNQLIRSVRLHRAKEFILQKNKNISEAAYMTGFNSVSYFTKCFKKEFGYTPSQID